MKSAKRIYRGRILPTAAIGSLFFALVGMISIIPLHPVVEAAPGNTCFGLDPTTDERGKLLLGTDGNDILVGTNGDDLIYGGGYSTHECPSNPYNDRLYGDAGNDEIHGLAGDDYIEGNHSNDIIYEDGGNDYMTGGLGNDSLYGGLGRDSLNGGLGTDYGNCGSDSLLDTINLSTETTINCP